MDFSTPNNVPWSGTFTIPGSADLLGASMEMQLRPTAISDSVALDLSSDNGRLSIIDRANRIGGIHVDKATMLQVTAGTYVFDCVVTPATGDSFIANSGNVNVSQGVTR